MLLKFLRIIANPSCKMIISTKTITKNISCRNAAYNNNTHYQNRLYSVQPTQENMTITYEEVKRATLNNEIFIIDVREHDEIKEHGKIPNSINIPLGDVAKVLSTMTETEFEQTYKRAKPSEDSTIIFYCMIGKRSGMAQQNAVNLGYKQVKNYLGSWTDWALKSKS